MTMRAVLLSMVVLFGAVTAAGAQTPGVRDVVAQERSVIPLATQVRYFTTIVLPDDEDVVEAACGDPMFWTVQASDNRVRVKPAKEGATSNLEVLGSSGTLYSFRLREVTGTKAEPDLRVHVRSERTADRPATKYFTAAQMQGVQTELKEAREALEREGRRATDAIAAHTAEYVTRLRFPYQWKDAKALHITAMWTDGQATYLQVDARELPTLYELVDGKPSLTNYHVQANTYIVPKVLERGYLTLGDTHVTFEQRR
jgi:type IV secretory pathway VirB9-like protein